MGFQTLDIGSYSLTASSDLGNGDEFKAFIRKLQNMSLWSE